MATKKATAAPAEVVTAYKGFDANLVCDPTGNKPFQYAIGGTYTHKGKPVRCQSGGFHVCESPLDVFGYYTPGASRYCLVEASGTIDRDGADTKIACASITLKAELKLPELIARAVDWITTKVTAGIDTSLAQTVVSGDYSAASNTGNRSAASNTGDYSAASVAGVHSVAMACGTQGKAMACAGSAIVLCYRNDGALVHVRATKVGENGTEPGLWYSLDANGEFVQVAAPRAVGPDSV